MTKKATPKKPLPVAVIFTHRGQEMDGLVLADKGICWQVELSDGTTLMVQKKHVTCEMTGDSFDEEAYVAATHPEYLEDPQSVITADPFEDDEPPAADSLASMLTKIRAEGKVSGKKAKPAAQAKPAAKPTQAKTPAAAPEFNNLISLKQLCAELNVEPRIARRRLRNSQGQVGTGSRWEWEADSMEIDAIRAIISAA